MKQIIKKINHRHALEVFIYAIVGGCAWVVQTIFYLLSVRFNVFPSIAMILGNGAGMVVAYFGHMRFTFKRTHKFSRPEFIKFMVTSIFGLLINVLGVRIMTKIFLLHPNYGIIPTIFTPGVTFLISKFWAFKQ